LKCKFRKRNVQNMTEIGQIYIYLTAAILALWLLIYVKKMILLYRKKQNITSLQAKISVLRMGIKKNLRQKINTVQRVNGLEKNIIQNVQVICQSLHDLDLNIISNYQNILLGLKNIFDIISETDYYISQQIQKLQADSEATRTVSSFDNFSFWQILFESDRSILSSIYEMVTTTNELKKQIVEYNLSVAASKQYKEIPELIHIEHINLLKRIITEDQILDSKAPEAEAA
jgi:hypothetical protein